MTDAKAAEIARLVGVAPADVRDILERWTGEPLGSKSAAWIAREITAHLDDLVKNP